MTFGGFPIDDLWILLGKSRELTKPRELFHSCRAQVVSWSIIANKVQQDNSHVSRRPTKKNSLFDIAFWHYESKFRTHTATYYDTTMPPTHQSCILHLNKSLNLSDSANVPSAIEEFLVASFNKKKGTMLQYSRFASTMPPITSNFYFSALRKKYF